MVLNNGNMVLGQVDTHRDGHDGISYTHEQGFAHNCHDGKRAMLELIQQRILRFVLFLDCQVASIAFPIKQTTA